MGKKVQTRLQTIAISPSLLTGSIDNKALSSLSANQHLRLANKYFSLAIEEYRRDGRSQEIIDHFRNSGIHFSRFFASDELPDKRDVLTVYYRALPCVVCFCDESEIYQFAELDEWRYCWPPIDINPVEWNIVTEPNIQSNVRRYLREVLKFLATGKLDEEACNELHTDLQGSQGVDKMSVAKELSLGILALQAIQNQQHEELHHHLLNLIKSHQQRAKRGQLRGDDSGAIAMQALMLTAIAKQCGIAIQLGEHYAPLNMLDVAL